MHNVRVVDELSELLASVDPKDLGRRIKQARVRREMTQASLAGDSASIGYISRIESGQRRPEIALLDILAGRLGLSVRALLTGAPDATEARIRLALDHAELELRGGNAARSEELLDEIHAEVFGLETLELRRRWLLTKALVSEALGRLDEAIVRLEDLLANSPDLAEASRAAIALSRCYRESGDFSRAIESGESHLRALKAMGLDGSDDAVQLAVTVAAAHFTVGDTAHAVRMCRRAIEKAEEQGSPVALASAYWNASIMESERGAPQAALPLAEKALQLLDAAESNRNVARLRSQMGIFQLRMAPPDVEGARANLEAAAQQLAWSSASKVDVGRNAVALARARLLSDSPAEAMAEAQAVLAEVGDAAPLLAVEALSVMGQAAFETGDSGAAAAHYREAVHTLTGIGSDRAAAEVWFELGSLLDELGLESEARQAYRSAAASTGLGSGYGLGRRSRAAGVST